MKLFLHIGSHKTATTAIQYFSRRNKDWLLERGLLYPSLELIGERPQQSHLGVMSGLFRLGERHAIDPAIGKKLLVTAAELASERGANVLLSAENLFRLAPEVREEAFELFNEIFTDFDRVVIAGLRRQDLLADSLYKSITKVNRRQPDFAPFLESRRGVFSYKDIITQAERGFPDRPILLPFTRSNNRDFLRLFFEAVGVDISNASTPSARQNVSYDLVDCLAKVALLDLRVHEQVLLKFDQFVQHNPVRTKYSFFTPESRASFMAEYEPQNLALLERYPELSPALDPAATPDVELPLGPEAEGLGAERLMEFKNYITGQRRAPAPKPADDQRPHMPRLASEQPRSTSQAEERGEKRVIIHAGLPKTGTSALQHWLGENRETLEKNGIYYPIHQVDANGISSGNWRSLLVRTDTGALQVDPKKVKATLEEFATRSESTLLISSEFLPDHIRELHALLPKATRFIVFVRDPIALRVSDYNQHVKRHGQTEKFNPGKFGNNGRPLLPFLKSVPALQSDGVDIALRAYHPRLFVGGTILNDLFHAAGIKVPFEETSSFTSGGRVNTSYTLHALEFKRAANRLPLAQEKIQAALDTALQRYDVGPADYSLIPPTELPRLRDLVDAELQNLEEPHGITSLSALREQLQHEAGRPYKVQAVQDTDIEAVAHYLRNRHPNLFKALHRLVQASPEVEFPYEAFRSSLK